MLTASCVAKLNHGVFAVVERWRICGRICGLDDANSDDSCANPDCEWLFADFLHHKFIWRCVSSEPKLATSQGGSGVAQMPQTSPKTSGHQN